MITPVTFTLAVVGFLQLIWAENTFENVERMSPTLSFYPLWANGPVQGDIDKIDFITGTPYIVGGQEAVPHSEPHQVYLIISGGKFCGGSLISDSWVVTAAHCAHKNENITAVVGAHNIRLNEPEKRVVGVEKIVVHPRWEPKFIRNDIALLKLSNRVTLDGKYVNAIRLPKVSDKNKSIWNSAVTMTGWGKDSDNSKIGSPVLRTVSSRVVTNFYCNLRYFLGIGRFLIHDSNICSSGWRAKGICYGDSGGPLYLTESDNQKTLIGISSFISTSGCESSWPPAFTRVTFYLDWIHKITGIAARN